MAIHLYKTSTPSTRNGAVDSQVKSNPRNLHFLLGAFTPYKNHSKINKIGKKKKKKLQESKNYRHTKT